MSVPSLTCNYPGLVQGVHGEAPDASSGGVTVTGDRQLEPHVPTRHGTAARASRLKGTNH